MFVASVSNSIDIIGFHIRYSHQFLQTDLNVLSKNPVLLLTLHVDYWLSWLVDGLEQLLVRVDIYYVFAVGLHSDYKGDHILSCYSVLRASMEFSCLFFTFWALLRICFELSKYPNNLSSALSCVVDHLLTAEHKR